MPSEVKDIKTKYESLGQQIIKPTSMTETLIQDLN